MPSAVVWIAHLAPIGWAVVSSSAAVLLLDLLRRWNARSTLAGHWQSEGSSAAAPRWGCRASVPVQLVSVFVGGATHVCGQDTGSRMFRNRQTPFFASRRGCHRRPCLNLRSLIHQGVWIGTVAGTGADLAVQAPRSSA